MKILLSLALLLSAAGSAAQAAPSAFELGLDDAERQALTFSPELQAAQLQAKAAEQSFFAARAGLYPKLALEGNYKYVARIASITQPNGNSIQLGDYNNYSIGPTLTWTLWDNGSLSENSRAAEADLRSKKAQADAINRKIRLNTRLAYLRALLANDKARLFADGLRIVRSQHRDIQASVKAGGKNRIDELVAHREVLARTNQISRVRAELSSAMLELSALTGIQRYAFQQPFPDKTELPEALPLVSESVALDDFSTVLGLIKTSDTPDLASPSLRALEETAQALNLAAEALESARGPKLLFSARSSLDYPNGPQLYAFGQNTAGVSLSLPLFEKGKTLAQANERRQLSEAGTRTRAQLELDIRRDWDKAQNQLSALFYQQKINIEAIAEAQDLAALMYRAYKDGRYTYFEVESANLRTLEAQLQAAETAAQILSQEALLASISTEEK